VRHRLLSGILVLLVLCVPSFAQPRVVKLRKGIRWVRTVEEAVVAARLTNAPIVVYAYYSNHAACLNFEEELLADGGFRRLTSLFVMVRLDGVRHRNVAEKFGIKRYPSVLYLDSGGEKLYLLDSKMTPLRVRYYMARTFLVSMYNGGRRAHQAGDVRRAVRRFRTLMIIGQGSPPADWAKRELKRISTEGIKKLSQARIALDEKDTLKAMTLLDELVYEYRATQAGAEARKLMTELSKDPEVVKTLKEVERRRRAARKLARARKLEEQKDPEAALITYWDILRDAPNTPAADDASARAAEMAADRALALRAAKTRMKRDCTQWMEMAEAFARNKRNDKAIEYYTRITTEYAGTSYARKARAAVNDLLGVVPVK